MSETVIYCRISKDRDGTGLGVERQERDCRELAARLGRTVAQVYVDNDVSAYRTKRRPAYEQMMTAVEAGQVEAILAYSNSRLTRRPLELERLITAHERTGAQLFTVVSGQDDLSTADGRMTARIRGNVDRAESERISERTRAAKADARAKGEWLGGHRPYGHDNEAEAKTLARAGAAILSGRSLTAVGRELGWGARTLRRRLLAAGSEDLRALLEDPSRRTSPGPVRRWLLSGLAHCQECGSSVRAGSAVSTGHGRYPAYRCPSGRHIVIHARYVDEFVGEVVVERLRRPDAAELFTAQHPDTTEARGWAAGLRARLNALADNLEIDEATLGRRARALRTELEAAEAQVASAARTSALGGFAGRKPGVVWAGLDLDQRRSVVGLLMDITITPATRGVVPMQRRWRADLPGFDPGRLMIEWKTF